VGLISRANIVKVALENRKAVAEEGGSA